MIQFLCSFNHKVIFFDRIFCWCWLVMVSSVMEYYTWRTCEWWTMVIWLLILFLRRILAGTSLAVDNKAAVSVFVSAPEVLRSGEFDSFKETKGSMWKEVLNWQGLVNKQAWWEKNGGAAYSIIHVPCPAGTSWAPVFLSEPTSRGWALLAFISVIKGCTNPLWFLLLIHDAF